MSSCKPVEEKQKKVNAEGRVRTEAGQLGVKAAILAQSLQRVQPEASMMKDAAVVMHTAKRPSHADIWYSFSHV